MIVCSLITAVAGVGAGAGGGVDCDGATSVWLPTEDTLVMYDPARKLSNLRNSPEVTDSSILSPTDADDKPLEVPTS